MKNIMYKFLYFCFAALFLTFLSLVISTFGLHLLFGTIIIFLACCIIWKFFTPQVNNKITPILSLCVDTTAFMGCLLFLDCAASYFFKNEIICFYFLNILNFSIIVLFLYKKIKSLQYSLKYKILILFAIAILLCFFEICTSFGLYIAMVYDNVSLF